MIRPLNSLGVEGTNVNLIQSIYKKSTANIHSTVKDQIVKDNAISSNSKTLKCKLNKACTELVC